MDNWKVWELKGIGNQTEKLTQGEGLCYGCSHHDHNGDDQFCDWFQVEICWRGRRCVSCHEQGTVTYED
jgi:hypothetical protein